MTSRYRHRRTNAPGTAFPSAIEPGEIVVNTANRQLVVGDADAGSPGVPLPMLPVRYFDARAQYGTGDYVVQAGVLYRAKASVSPGTFNPSQWDVYSGDAALKAYADAGDASVTTAYKAADIVVTNNYQNADAAVTGVQAADAALQTNINAKADKSYVDSQDALKANKTYVDLQDAALQTNINAKADTTYVNAADALKADKTYVDSQDATKADKTYVDAADALKADKTYVDAQDATKAPLASPVFTGDPKAPTPAPGDNDTSIATTAFVAAAVASVGGAPAGQFCTKLLDGNTLQNTAFHAFLMKDGSVRVGGSNSATYGNSVPPASVGNGAAFGAGQTTIPFHVAKRVGMPPGLLGTPTKIIAYGNNVMVLTDQGDLCAWGANNQGELGVGDVVVHYAPTLVSAANITPRSAGGVNRAVVELTHSQYHGDNVAYGTVYARCADGTMWAWGYNGYGQMGDATAVAKNVPTQCLKNDGASNIAITDCAKLFAGGGGVASSGYIDTLGKVRLAGALRAGAVGRNVAGGTQNVFRPIFTSTDNAGSDLPPAYQCLEAFVGGSADSIYIRCADKCAYAWGYNAGGACGIGNATQQNNPKKVGGGTAVAATLNGTVERIFQCGPAGSAGAGAIAQLTDGSVWGWGLSTWYETPVGTVVANTTPKQCTGLLAGIVPQILQVVNGGYVGQRCGSAALLADGRVVGWGYTPLDGVSNAAAAQTTPILVAVPTIAGALPVQIKMSGTNIANTASISGFWLEILYANGQVYGCGRSLKTGGAAGVVQLDVGLPLGLAVFEPPTMDTGTGQPTFAWPMLVPGEWPVPKEIAFA